MQCKIILNAVKEQRLRNEIVSENI